MAQFPYLQQAGFESGSLDTGVEETDTASAGAIYHYTDTVKKWKFAPWRGAYCYVIDQSVCTTTECKLVSAGCNVTATQYWSMGFAFFAKNTVMATTNRTSLVKLLNGTTVEVCLQLYYSTAEGLMLLLTEANDTDVGSWTILTENTWHWIELYGVNDPGANDGTANMVIDGEACGSVGSLNQLAITDMQIGLDDQDAGHTAGVYAFDDIIFTGINTSAVRTGLRSRYPMNPHVSAISTSTYLDCLFVGPGTVSDMTLLTSASGDYIRLYDTDSGVYTGDYAGTLIAEAAVSPSVPIVAGPLVFERGCLAVVTGAGATGCRGVIRIDPAPQDGNPAATCYGNKANLFNYAYSRSRRPGNL